MNRKKRVERHPGKNGRYIKTQRRFCLTPQAKSRHESSSFHFGSILASQQCLVDGACCESLANLKQVITSSLLPSALNSHVGTDESGAKCCIGWRGQKRQSAKSLIRVRRWLCSSEFALILFFGGAQQNLCTPNRCAEALKQMTG